MGKGRVHAPSTEKDGSWFVHHGVQTEWPPHRLSNTTTGRQYDDQFVPERAKYPPIPPDPWNARYSRNFKKSNEFTAHVNRYAHENHGDHFGDGRLTREFGKRLTDPPHYQHVTDVRGLNHNYGRSSPEFHLTTVNKETYRGLPTMEPPQHRRFRKVYKADPNAVVPTTTLTDFVDAYGEVNYKTDTELLGVTLQPYMKRNNWKYAYRKGVSAYPEVTRGKMQQSYPVWEVCGEKGQNPPWFILQRGESVPDIFPMSKFNKGSQTSLTETVPVAPPSPKSSGTHIAKEKIAVPEKVEQVESAEKVEKVEKVEKPEKPATTSKSEKAVKSTSSKTEKAEKEKVDKSSKADKSDKEDKAEKPHKSDKEEKPHKSDKSDKATKSESKSETKSGKAKKK